jgi:hypothetical protein
LQKFTAFSGERPVFIAGYGAVIKSAGAVNWLIARKTINLFKQLYIHWAVKMQPQWALDLRTQVVPEGWS